MNRFAGNCQKWWKKCEKVVEKWWGESGNECENMFGFTHGCSVSMFGLWESEDLHKFCRYLCGEIYTWNLFGFNKLTGKNFIRSKDIHIST